LERSERYWRMAAEAFHSAFMARNEGTRSALMRVAMAWAALANELEEAEASLYWASGRDFPVGGPIRPNKTETPEPK